VQICETILFLQRALDEKTIDGRLAERVNARLQERGEAFVKPLSGKRTYGTMRTFGNAVVKESTRWLERDEQLFALAADVSAAMRSP
jgi:hypothetical protein